MRILFLSRWFPLPAVNGSKIRVLNLLRQLAPRHEVTLLSFLDDPAVDPRPALLRELCERVVVVPWKPYRAASLPALLAFFGPTPRSVADTFSPEMARQVSALLGGGAYDLVVASQLDTARYAPWLSGAPALFEEVEVGTIHDAAADPRSPLASRLRRRLTWAKQRRYLGRLLQSFDACTVVSERERGLVERVAPGGVTVEMVPNALDLTEYDTPSCDGGGEGLVFTGSLRFRPNYDAMRWFIASALPRIRDRVPGVGLTITGAHDDLPLPDADGVVRTGSLDDVRPVIAAACIGVVPLRSGGGTRLKILEAMALGTPLVSTSKGAEGLQARDGVHLLIADDAVGFADGIVRLLSDRDLRRRLARNARRLVEERYDWRRMGPSFEDLVVRVARQGAARAAKS